MFRKSGSQISTQVAGPQSQDPGSFHLVALLGVISFPRNIS